MIIEMFDMPSPNNGERYDLSVEDLSKWMQKAYAHGVLWGESIIREKYESKLTYAVYPDKKKKKHKKEK